MNKILKEFIIFIIFGIVYFLLEILWRGYSSPFMILLGGICGVLIGLINEITPKMKISQQMILGAIIITILEFIFGYILNIKFVLSIWDYSNVPFNIMGQICPLFSFLWFLLSYFVIRLDDFLKEVIK